MSPGDDDEKESTRAGMPLPPGAKPGVPDKPAHEETHIGGSMPVLPGAKPPARPQPAPPPERAVQPPPAAPPPASAANEDATRFDSDDDLEATVFEVRSPFSLMRVKPPGHAAPITLSASSYVLGRSRTSDIQLFSASASRQHAKLSSRGGGWVLQPMENHIVIANGDLVRGEIQVTHKMRLQLGDDELVFFDERKAATQTRTEKSIPPLRKKALPPWAPWALIGVAAIVVAAVMLWSVM